MQTVCLFMLFVSICRWIVPSLMCLSQEILMENFLELSYIFIHSVMRVKMIHGIRVKFFLSRAWSLKTPLEKGKGIRVSIWTFPAEKEKELKEMILDLLPLESTALLKPSFAAYNSHIDRAILCCTPCTSNLTSWIAKQVQIPSDSYLQEDSKNMIRYA